MNTIIRGLEKEEVTIYMYNCVLDIHNGDLNVHSWLDGDGGDLLHHLGWGLKVDQSLMNSHFIAIPSFGTLSARCLTGGDLEYLGWHSDWSLDPEGLLLGSTNKISAHFLQIFHISGSEGDTNAMHLRGLSLLHARLGNRFDCGGHLICDRQRIYMLSNRILFELKSKITRI
jgi:hypothetical protein